MQPYFAPALAYFDLIALTDEWVVFDTPAFRKKSWMSRNRILHPSTGWQYITAGRHSARGLPTLATRSKPLCDLDQTCATMSASKRQEQSSVLDGNVFAIVEWLTSLLSW